MNETAVAIVIGMVVALAIGFIAGYVMGGREDG